ncbi:PQQ-dependent sugar dehydrogenase [Ketogulonicigenium vulgare]|uniref:PQQ-dependent sugar dehydrogenase n=1 Tax=Ketogulonicigenium vulgare TaxID=92945 RepID=UPI00235889CD|nr:PQQ-dependent sugar dehydrogenase [Ketogulonicigenium vulgare]
MSQRNLRKALATSALALAFAGAASAQDFNEAPPNDPNQSPAFEGQTRAPVIADDIALSKDVFAGGLVNPWGMDQLPDGSWLVTERPGRLRHVGADGTLSEPITGIPEVDSRGQGGLLDVTVADDFDSTRRIWFSFAEPRGGETNATAVGTGILSEDNTALSDVEVIFQQQPAWESTLHFGSRLVFAPDGALFVTTGERSLPEPRELSQDVTTHLGKVIRITPEGGAADGNPAIEGGLPEIWSYGHRNLQGATIGPDGALWTIEHGPRGGDELNRPEAGLNYGWPVITYGINYSGEAINTGITAQEGMEQPLYFWDPSIATSNMVFYEGDLFPDWQNSLLIGSLAGQSLVRLTLDGTAVTGEARYFAGEGRIRDVDVGADGAIYLLIDAEDGQMLRVTPAE